MSSTGPNISGRRHSMLTSSRTMDLPQSHANTIKRPSSAHERRSNDSSSEFKPRGILKKTQSPMTSPAKRTTGRESPDAWFQRIMHVNKLSPLDLCERFSYGGVRKHPLVPLSYVCEVLFDLDPECANGADPVTKEMEDFLYQFAKEERGSLVVNIREALRALDIWKSRVDPSEPPASDAHSKEILLESNRKLMDVISDLQDANLRLSRQLHGGSFSSSLRSPDKLSRAAQSPRSRTAPGRFSVEEPIIKSSTNALSSSPSKSTSLISRVVNLHEKELVDIATKLQYTGVRHLEETLGEGDQDSSGFMSLKQLCQILVNKFQLDISETKLAEVCMGMSFNAQAQLDYKEFVNVLLDILIYALPNIRESAKQKSLIRLDEYLQSGFPPNRDGTRRLLGALCAKYDIEGDLLISLSDLVRAFHVDLVKKHELNQPFPLDEQELMQLAQPFIQRSSKGESEDGFICYPELLDAILGPHSPVVDSDSVEMIQSKRALRWGFWRDLHLSLCGNDPRMERKVVKQVRKIFAKLDTATTFTISRRYFRRVFEQHISSDNMAVLETALAIHEASKEGKIHGPSLRYDVLLKLIFGSPQLSDGSFFDHHIRAKLFPEQERLRRYLSELVENRGPAHRLSIKDFYDVFITQAEAYPLTMTAMLYLFGSMDDNHDGSVEARIFKQFLATRCWTALNSAGDSVSGDGDGENGNSSNGHRSGEIDIHSIKKLITNCFGAYDLERSLATHARRNHGWIPHSALESELVKMLHKLGVTGVQSRDLKRLVQFMGTTEVMSTQGNKEQSSRNAVHYDTFFDALMDWDALISALGLPGTLVKVKKAFFNFDWKRSGSIGCQDWNKAWRAACHKHKGMADWELRVIQRRFSGEHEEGDQTINYINLLEYLAAYHHQSASNSAPTKIEHQQVVPVAPSPPRRHQTREDLSHDKRHDEHQVLSSLRALEISIVQIADQFADAKGNILPAKTFRHLLFGPSTVSESAQRSRSNSPQRYANPDSPTRRYSRVSVTTRSQQRELESSSLDPLTPETLKQTLKKHHRIDVSTHLISQFFLHIGSSSKHFLDLPCFARWAAPLSPELQAKARGIVRQMTMKGKGGGGKVDLDQFMAHLQRRFQDTPQYMGSSKTLENEPLQHVSASLLLSKLHQLNISLKKQELIALLRHFGMGVDLDAVDYSLFLHRMYELNASASTS